MDDLLSELDSIDDDVAGSSRGKQDGSSSPLRPNSKYCTMVQPAAMKPAAPWNAARWKGAGANATPVGRIGGMDPLPWEKERGRTSSSTPSSARGRHLESSAIPETVQKILAVTTASGMEVDEDPPDNSSSPLKPNEKYCAIVTPKPRVVRVAPLLAAVPPPPPLSWKQASPPYPGHHVSPGVHGGASTHYRRSSGSGDHAPNYSTPRREPRRYSSSEEKALAEWNRQRELEEERRRGQEDQRKRELQRRASEEAAKAERVRRQAEERRRYEERQEQERRRQREIEEERKRSRQRRLEEEAARVARIKKEADDKRRYEEDILKKVEERQRAERRTRAQEDEERRQRNARAMLKSYADVNPKREEGTVRMTREELEELKARCQAEGERLAEARRAEAAAAAMNQRPQVDPYKEEEPEPMEVEESDSVESCLPTNCTSTRIAPIPLIVKAEPPDVVESARLAVSLDEIPLPPGPVPQEKGNEEVAKEADQGEIQIIEKPPAEVVTLSDDEGTVAELTVGDGHQSIKQELPTATKEQEEDFWIVGSKRGRKKAHVFDPSKVKKEKEDVGEGKVSESSATTQSISFNAARVKEDPGMKEKEMEEGRKDKKKEEKRMEKEKEEERKKKEEERKERKKEEELKERKERKRKEEERADKEKEKSKERNEKKESTVGSRSHRVKVESGEKDKSKERKEKKESSEGASSRRVKAESREKEKSDEEKEEKKEASEGAPSLRVKSESGEKEKGRKERKKEGERKDRKKEEERKDKKKETSEGASTHRAESREKEKSEEGKEKKNETAHQSKTVDSGETNKMKHFMAEFKKTVSAEPQEVDVAAALVAARRLLREICQPEQQQQQPRPTRPSRLLRQPHEPAPGSFMHSLRGASRKRRRWCDYDEDEEEWLRVEDSTERHEWGAKRERMEEEEDQ